MSVFLRNEHNKVVVNAIHVGSTKTYLNADVLDELLLQGETQQVTVNMINRLNTISSHTTNKWKHSKYIELKQSIKPNN